MVNSFDEFCGELLKSGFSMGSGNAKGIYAIIPFNWTNSMPDCPIAWHTGETETDPWEWRMRVLEERDDIAYGKVFFGTSGYITKEWYPYFLAVRRQGLTFDEWYDEGKAGQFDRALTNLQKNLFITMCGRTQKLSRNGEPYGWNSTVFTTMENFWGEDLTATISAEEAYEKIRERILLLNPEAKEKDIKKFIG